MVVVVVKSCCTSVNEVICHGIPDSTVLKDGDMVNIDITVYYNGFHGAVTRRPTNHALSLASRPRETVTRDASSWRARPLLETRLRGA